MASAATKTFTAVLQANPLVKGAMIAVGIAGVVAGVASFTNVIKSNTDAVEDYNGTLEQCSTEIDNTRTAYENVCNMYGAESQAAQNLASELETLNAQYQKGGGFAADYAQRLEESKQALDSFTAEYNGKMDEIDKDWQNGMVAVAQLEALSKQSELTNADLDMMSQYADYLNDTFNCNIEVDYDTGKLTGFDPTDINTQIASIAEENRKQVAIESITDVDFQNQYMDRVKNLESEKKRLEYVQRELKKVATDPSYVNTEGWEYSDIEDIEKQISEYERLVDKSQNKIREAYSTMGYSAEEADAYAKSLSDVALSFGEIEESAEEAQKAMTPEEAIYDVWAVNEEQIKQFAEEYEEAYDSIRESLDGMFGLFEEASMNLENALSPDTAIENIESQIDYFNQYKEAVATLSDLELDSNIIEQLDPEQAVAFAQSFNEMNVDEAKGKVSELNESFGELKNIKDDTAQTMLEVDEEISQRLDAIKENMDKSLDEMVEEMKLDSEAADAAKLTMDGYISQLKSSGDTAVQQAQSIASRITAALSVDVSTAVSNAAAAVRGFTANVNAYASGTLSAEPGIALVGEEGPELVRFKGGETVYTADETEQIISGYADNHFSIPPSESPVKKFENKTESVSRREVDLNINGKGSINVKSNMDKEQVADILIENLKPALMSIISTELFEEGENSYDF